MLTTLFIAQAAGLSLSIWWFARREELLLRAQLLVWFLGVSALTLTLGLTGQLGFYSTDQRYYNDLVVSFSTTGVPWDVDVWLGSKIPYTVASLPLVLLGIHPTLALKTVSLICLLALSRALLRDGRSETRKNQIATLWLTACGTIGTFFSLLALRETMMMYFVYRFATSRSVAVRGTSLVALYLLRPHLAAAVAAAEVVMVAWRRVRNGLKLGVAESSILVVIGVVIGTTLFSWGVSGSSGLRTPFNGGWGISQAVRVASNFVGLQFLTVREETVEFSIARLLLLRLVLNETIVIPVAFTIVCLFAARHLTDRGRFTLLAFTIYSSVVVGTDFNSFRQNIPFMPLMGLVVLNAVRSRTTNSESKTFEAGRMS